MSCLDKIIAIKDPCTGEADVTPLSGYYITDYPGVTIQAAANSADEKTVTGIEYLRDVRRRAMLRLKSDLLAYVNSEYRVNSIPNSVYKGSSFVIPYTTISAGDSEKRRGVVLSKLKTYCRFYKINVDRVRIYSGQDATGVILKVADVGTGTVTNYTIDLVEGEIIEFELNKLCQGNEVQITLPSNIVVYSCKPDCGCNGASKNEYIQVFGVSSNVTNTSECYGIEVDCSMRCDLSTMVCDLAQDGLIGQAAYELCGAMFYDELIKNNRLSYLTIYKGDQIKEQAQAGFMAYTSYMEKAMMGLRNYIVNNDGGCKCVDCSGVQIKTNV